MPDTTPDTKPLTPAASLILLRDTAGALEVFLLQRGPGAHFMANKYVFPGGVVDAADRDTTFWQHYIDSGPGAIDARLGGDLPWTEALAFSVTAIRETLEEAGILLGYNSHGRSAAWQHAAQWRLKAGLSRSWFQHLVAQNGWVLQLKQIARWSRWITPTSMHHRFDTRFFWARMPHGQSGQADGRETVRGVWVRPQAALARNLAGSMPLSPPTLVTLQELLPYLNVHALSANVADRGWGAALRPRLVSSAKGAVILEPWDPQYHEPDNAIETAAYADRVVAPGETFSRLWYHGEIWHPVRTPDQVAPPMHAKNGIRPGSA